MSKDSSDADSIMKLKSPLQHKVPVGGVDAASVEKANEIVAAMADDYVICARSDLKKIEQILASILASLETSDEATYMARLDAILAVAHDMKGQGGSFGYELITIIAHNLCNFINGIKEGNTLQGKEDRQNEIIGIHVDALRVVISKNIKNDGGAIGKEIIVAMHDILAQLR